MTGTASGGARVCLLLSRREEGERRSQNGVGQCNVVEGLSGGADVGAATRGVAGGTVASMGAGEGETEQNRNFRFTNPELPVSKPGTSGFGAKQIQIWSAQN